MPGLFFGGDMAKGNDQDLPLPAGEKHAPLRQAGSRGRIAVNLSFMETLALSRS